jgi:undecaprenyl-diphosphatase
LESIFLGIIQGLTEFLPISSSGHLVIFQTILGVEGPTLFFDLLLHFGTLIAIVVIFRNEFVSLGCRLINREKLAEILGGEIRDTWNQDENLRMWILVVVGTVPTFLLAYLIREPVEEAFHSSTIVGIALFVTGLLLAVTRWIRGTGRGIIHMTLIDALVIGVAQGIAVVPGISRSGITIVAGIVMGLKGDVAAKYSFLLSVPAILGAIVFEIVTRGALGGENFGLYVELMGCCMAFLSGLIALKIVMGFVSSGRLYLFSYYCIPLSVIVLGSSWI